MKLKVKVTYEGDRVPLGDGHAPQVWHFEQRDTEGEWPTLSLRIEVRDGIPLVRGVHIGSTADGMEVQTAHLRNVPLEDLVEYIGGVVRQELAMWEDLPEGESVITVDDVKRARQEGKMLARAQRRKRRRTVTRAMLAEVAEVYLAAESAPVKAVEEHFGKSRRTASWYVMQAREAGLIPTEGD